MAIIISQNGKNAKKIEKSDFGLEDHLQNYIYDNPEVIPLYNIRDDIVILILAREFPTPSGPIDAIAIDKEGNIYLIETKLYRNADKRFVVAQVLDYGAALWRASVDFAAFLEILAESVEKKWGISLKTKIQEFFNVDEISADNILENMRQNLNHGNFKFVVLMDKLHSQLKDLIIFLNQNSRFNVYAVEVEYYKYNELEIMIPKLFGAEVKKEVGSGSDSQRRKWTEDEVLQDAKEKFEDQYPLFEKIYMFCKTKADKINFGSGSYGSFSPIFSKLSSKSLFTMGTDKRLSFNFGWVSPDNEKSAELFKDKLESIGFQLPQNYKKIYPSFYLEKWGPKTEEFIEMLKGIV